MHKEQITLIGRGWLGAPLVKTLEDNRYNVQYTTTTPKKEGILFDILNDDIPSVILKCDILIYCIPPLPLEKIKPFFSHFKNDQKIIFISSTSVYGKSQGKTNEQSIRLPETENGKNLKVTEDFLTSHFKYATIIRPGGLYGNGRHPVHFLKGRKCLTNGDEYLHLAHLDDCLGAIVSIINYRVWGETFNLVSDLKMKKSQYYPFVANKLGLQSPSYEKHNISQPTEIDNQKSKTMLFIQYKNPLEDL